MAQCTRLQKLTIPCATAEELGVAAPALQNVRELRLNCLDRAVPSPGDALVELLLGLPHLATLHWDNCFQHTFHRDFSAAQWRARCRWAALDVGWASPRALARLPLHSLTQPMEWRLLRVEDDGPDVLRRQLQAAVANLTRRCPAGFRWAGGSEVLPQLILACSQADVAEALRALRPLTMQPSMTGLSVVCVDWTAPLVRALGEALPRACERLSLRKGGAPWAALAQVVASLPWVRRLDLETLEVRPEDVVALAREVRRSRQQQQQQQLGGNNLNNTPAA